MPPYTTSSLQQDAVKKLNFSTKKTMLLAQQLYEGVNVGKGGAVGLITYMRTDSVRLSDVATAELRSFIGSTYGTEYVPAGVNVYSSKRTRRTRMKPSARPLWNVRQKRWRSTLPKTSLNFIP